MRRFIIAVLVVALGGLRRGGLVCQAGAGRRPQVNPAVQDLVQAALENEAAGDNAQRADNLQKALGQSPQDAATHWQLGQVRRRPMAHARTRRRRSPSGDKRLARSRRLRDRGASWPWRARPRWPAGAGGTSSPGEEHIHWQILLQLQPGNPEAIRGPRAKAVAGHVADAGANPAGQGPSADLGKGRGSLAAAGRPWRNAVKRHQTAPPAELRDKLVKLSDPTEVVASERALWQEVGTKRHKEAYHAMLLAVDSNAGREPGIRPRPSRWPGTAALPDFKDVRTAAIESLKKRPFDQFAPLLVSGMQMPIQGDARYSLGLGGELIAHFDPFRCPVARRTYAEHQRPRNAPSTRMVAAAANFKMRLTIAPYFPVSGS